MDITERVSKLREQVLRAPEICVERGCLITESYKETEGEPPIMRRAKALLRDRCQEPRKAPSECYGCPYRKPTQVGEERILRRSSEPPLRNSANWFRNFGIRNATVK